MTFVGAAKLLLGADTEAVEWLRRSIEANRNFPAAHFFLAATLALLGEPDQARAAAQAGLALNPRFTIHTYRTNAVSDNPTYLAGRERILEGLRLAGVRVLVASALALPSGPIEWQGAVSANLARTASHRCEARSGCIFAPCYSVGSTEVGVAVRISPGCFSCSNSSSLISV
jgi:tetratricopeptide (TPR) repeat protein